MIFLLAEEEERVPQNHPYDSQHQDQQSPAQTSEYESEQQPVNSTGSGSVHRAADREMSDRDVNEEVVQRNYEELPVRRLQHRKQIPANRLRNEDSSHRDEIKRYETEHAGQYHDYKDQGNQSRYQDVENYKRQRQHGNFHPQYEDSRNEFEQSQKEKGDSGRGYNESCKEYEESHRQHYGYQREHDQYREDYEADRQVYVIKHQDEYSRSEREDYGRPHEERDVRSNNENYDEGQEENYSSYRRNSRSYDSPQYEERADRNSEAPEQLQEQRQVQYYGGEQQSDYEGETTETGYQRSAPTEQYLADRARIEQQTRQTESSYYSTSNEVSARQHVTQVGAIVS